jgi:O-methyltransferase
MINKIIFKKIYDRSPKKLRIVLQWGFNIFFDFVPKFSGIGMKTVFALPWEDKYDEEPFRNTVKKAILNSDSFRLSEKSIMARQWRYWIVAYSIRHAIEFTNMEKPVFVEAGSENGLSAFFALNEIESLLNNDSYFFHLYDAWDDMMVEKLLPKEEHIMGAYSKLDIDRCKKNLTMFQEHLYFHQGYIPETFISTSDQPEKIIWLAIDLNSAIATKDCLDFFYPRLEKGGVIIFDDYGFDGYEDTKNMIEEFLHSKLGTLLKFPTGQAIFFKN